MTKPLTVLSLFSGIAGWECGCQLSGLDHIFTVTQFVEKNPFCKKVLQKHFPTVPIHSNIEDYNAKPGQFDIICASPPCQSFSCAGRQKAGTDNRDMFPELFRLLRQVRPSWVLIENVRNLLAVDSGRYFRGILWEFSKLGFDAEWSVISVASLGGVHKRDRIFIIAYPNSNSDRCNGGSDHREERHIQDNQKRDAEATSANGEQLFPESGQVRQDVAYPQGTRRYPPRNHNTQTRTDVASISSGDAIADSSSRRLEDTEKTDQGRAIAQLRSTELTNTNSAGLEAWQCEPSPQGALRESKRSNGSSNGQPQTSPSLRRGDAWVPSRLDRDNLMRHSDLAEWLPNATDTADIPHRKERLMALGNSCTPNQAAVVWRRLAEIIEDKEAA